MTCFKMACTTMVTSWPQGFMNPFPSSAPQWNMSNRCLEAHLLATYSAPTENICRSTSQTFANRVICWDPEMFRGRIFFSTSSAATLFQKYGCWRINWSPVDDILSKQFANIYFAATVQLKPVPTEILTLL